MRFNLPLLSFAIIFPLHLLYLTRTTGVPASRYLQGIKMSLSQLLVRGLGDVFPTGRFITLVGSVTLGATVPGVMWYISVTFAPYALLSPLSIHPCDRLFQDIGHHSALQHKCVLGIHHHRHAFIRRSKMGPPGAMRRLNSIRGRVLCRLREWEWERWIESTHVGVHALG